MLIAILVALVSGLCVGYYVDTSVLQLFINPLLLTLLLPIMVVIEYRKALSRQNLRLQVFTQLYNFTVVPLFAWLFVRLFFADYPTIAFGFLFYMLLPTAAVAIFWTRQCQGNTINSIKTMLFGLIIGAFLAPFLLRLLLADGLQFSSLEVLRANLVFLVVPLSLGYLLQKLLLWKYSPDQFMLLKPKIMLISQISILFMVFIGVSLKAYTLVSDPAMLVRILVPVALFYLLQYTLSHFVGGVFLNGADRISFVYSTSLKNISLALGICLTLLQEDASGVIILISLTYVIQQLSAPIYAQIAQRTRL